MCMEWEGPLKLCLVHNLTIMNSDSYLYMYKYKNIKIYLFLLKQTQSQTNCVMMVFKMSKKC